MSHLQGVLTSKPRTALPVLGCFFSTQNSLTSSTSPSFSISPALASPAKLSKHLPNQTALWKAFSLGLPGLGCFGSTFSFCIASHTSSHSSRLSESSTPAVSDKEVDCKQIFLVCVHVNAYLCSRLEILKLFYFLVFSLLISCSIFSCACNLLGTCPLKSDGWIIALLSLGKEYCRTVTPAYTSITGKEHVGSLDLYGCNWKQNLALFCLTVMKRDSHNGL